MLRANIIFNTSKLYIFYINDIRVSFDNFSALSSLVVVTLMECIHKFSPIGSD